MGPLKMKICLKYQKYAKTITCDPNFVIGLCETKLTFHCARQLCNYLANYTWAILLEVVNG